MVEEKKPVILGVIGGSGIYEMEGVQVVAEHDLETPFGPPSDSVAETSIGERMVMFLPRHGRGHRLLPSEVNARANIHALKQLGVTHALAISVVGSMQEHICPGDMVVPDQIFDRTRGVRASTFFGEGIVGHMSFADPFCHELRQLVYEAAKKADEKTHEGGTYVCMEGPQFSTRAESRFYRQALNASVIGMTALPEAKLAREAEMCYAMLAMCTDYDCWHDGEEDVSIESVLEVLKSNARKANEVVRTVSATLPQESGCECLRAARDAIITAEEFITDEIKERLDVLYGPYFSREKR